LFKKYYTNVNVSTLTEQQIQFDQLRDVSVPVVSLDAMIQGDENLRISRLYTPFGMRKLGYTEAKVDFSLGECYVFDDDIHTGGTIKHATSVLNASGIDVVGVFALTLSDGDEILDCRDFLLGHPNGGLVVRLPDGSVSRVPYVYPFVCPMARASILNPVPFSIEVWTLNSDYYATNKTTVAELPEFSGALVKSGFSLCDDMKIVCDVFANRLTDSHNIN
jgi:hypothetical protein